MYHPLEPCGTQVLLAYRFLWMINLHPWGESGILLKSNVLSNAVYADIIGLGQYCLNKFNVNVSCLIRLQNKCIGKFGSVLQSPEMKWFQKFGLIFLLHLFYVPLEALSGLLIPGSDCIYLEHCMPHYKTNVFLSWTTPPWVSHDMLCMPILCPFMLWYWEDLTKLYCHHMSIRWIHNSPPCWMWMENDLFGLSVIFLHPTML